jgi:two-component system, cell cycle response regulator DivK
MRTILVVEDMELNRDLLAQLLQDRHRLVFAADGLAALVRASADRPDLILMDLSLPMLDGWEATRRLKADPALASIPVIALTAHAMNGDEQRALACGCDGFLTKPVDEDLLEAAIARHLGGGPAAA